MTPEQAGESVRGVAWLVSLAFALVVGYLSGRRHQETRIRSLEQRLDAVKEAAAALLAERPLTAVDHLLARHDLTLKPAILQARATARRADAWLREQRGEAS